MQYRSLVLTLCFFLGFSASSQITSSQKSSLPDIGRDDAIGFSIADTGYVLGGRMSDFAISHQVWAYHPESDSWELKSPFPGTARQYSQAFVLDGQAYVVGGLSDPSIFLDEVWKYNPGQDTWQQLNAFPGGARIAGLAFVKNEKAYFGLGRSESEVFNDIWEYVPSSDTWSLQLSFPKAVYSPVSFTLASERYIGLGIDSLEVLQSDIWIFEDDTFRFAGSYPTSVGNADAMSMEDMAVVVGGRTNHQDALPTYRVALPSQNSEGIMWQSPSSLVGDAKRNGTSFTIGNSGYYFGGKNELGEKSNDLLEFRISGEIPKYHVYPNPALTHLVIHSVTAFGFVEIYDLQGKLVQEEIIPVLSKRMSFSLNELARGTYFLKIDGRSGGSIVVY